MFVNLNESVKILSVGTINFPFEKGGFKTMGKYQWKPT